MRKPKNHFVFSSSSNHMGMIPRWRILTSQVLMIALLLGGAGRVSHAQEDLLIDRHDDGYSLQWNSEDGTTSFIQHSTDLVNWQFTPHYHVGDASARSHVLSDDRGPAVNSLSFFRLLLHPTNPADPDDTDGDGLKNTFELGNGYSPTTSDSDGNGTNDGDEDPDPDWFEYRIGPEANRIWKFRFTIQPAEIVDMANDIPALDGLADNRKKVPGHNKPYPVDPQKKADTAERKWDVTRQMSMSIRNPGLIPKEKLDEHFTGQWTDGQPKLVHTPVPFPNNPVEGNDDPFPEDEDNNPYQASNRLGLEHAVGQLTSFDGPGWSVLDSWGTANNQEFTAINNFREFARVQLWDGNRANGNFWFRISNYGFWHHSLKAKFSDPPKDWNDNGSSSALGHKAP